MPFLDKAGVSRLWMHIIAKLNTKIDREDGKGLSTNDYTDEEKSRLEEVYTRISEGDIPSSGGVQADWEQSDENAYDYIKNKPDIATDEDIMDMLAELDIIAPVTTADGAILTSPIGEIYIL